MQILNAGMLTVLLHFYVALHYKIQILESSQMFVWGGFYWLHCWWL